MKFLEIPQIRNLAIRTSLSMEIPQIQNFINQGKPDEGVRNTPLIQAKLVNVVMLTINYYTLNHQQVEIVPIESEPELFEVKKCLDRLGQLSLDPFKVSFLDLLDQPVVFTPTELEYLCYVEQRYSKVNN